MTWKYGVSVVTVEIKLKYNQHGYILNGLSNLT